MSQLLWFLGTLSRHRVSLIWGKTLADLEGLFLWTPFAFRETTNTHKRSHTWRGSQAGEPGVQPAIPGIEFLKRTPAVLENMQSQIYSKISKSFCNSPSLSLFENRSFIPVVGEDAKVGQTLALPDPHPYNVFISGNLPCHFHIWVTILPRILFSKRRFPLSLYSRSFLWEKFGFGYCYCYCYLFT